MCAQCNKIINQVVQLSLSAVKQCEKIQEAASASLLHCISNLAQLPATLLSENNETNHKEIILW